MNDFNPRSFAAGAFLATLGVTSIVASMIMPPARVIDNQRLLDREVFRARAARARGAVVRRLVDASLASAAASEQLRRAALRAGMINR